MNRSYYYLYYINRFRANDSVQVTGNIPKVSHLIFDFTINDKYLPYNSPLNSKRARQYSVDETSQALENRT
jgi:hypothetical protein